MRVNCCLNLVHHVNRRSPGAPPSYSISLSLPTILEGKKTSNLENECGIGRKADSPEVHG